MIEKILQKTWMIRKSKDGTHKFNIYNPLAYIVLLVYAILGAVSSAGIEFFKLIFSTFKDSVEYKFQWGIVLWISAGLISIVVWLL